MKGLAHVGIIKALDEHGFLPAEVVGSSVGALIGAVWCSGMAIPDMRELALELKRRDLFRVAHRDMAFKRMLSPALYRKEPLYDLVNGLLGDLTFDDLERQLLVNTVDLNTGMQVFWGLPGLRDVRVADAVYASCALPGYLPPHDIRGTAYVDGAVVSNLPTNVARAYKRDLVIAVDVGSSGAVRAELQHAGFAAIYSRAQEIAIQTMRDRQLASWKQPPLLLLQPRVEHIPMFSFSHNEELVDEGYRSADDILRNNLVPGPECSGIFPKRRVKVRVEPDRCIGCGACLFHAPEGFFFIAPDGKAVVNEPNQVWSPLEGGFVRHCPTYAIVARWESEWETC